MKVFLGGTCNNSTWREKLIPELKRCGIAFFNPVVKDWTPACQKEEIKQRRLCDWSLYVITKEMHGLYSIAEAVDDSHKKNGKVIFCYLPEGFDEAQIKSLDKIGEMIEANGGYCCTSLEDVLTTLILEGM